MVTGSDTQVIPPSASHYRSLEFSPDENYIYFVKAQGSVGYRGDVYRAPVLGGTPQIVIHGIDYDIAVSPDGHRIAYVRVDDQTGNYRLLSASVDGNDEKVLQTGPKESAPDHFAWSPDNEQIASGLWVPENALGGVDLLSVDDGKTRRLASFNDKLTIEMAWSPDGRPFTSPTSPKVRITFTIRSDGYRPKTASSTLSRATPTLITPFPCLPTERLLPVCRPKPLATPT